MSAATLLTGLFLAGVAILTAYVLGHQHGCEHQARITRKARIRMERTR